MSKYVKDFNAAIKCPYYNEKFNIGKGAINSNCDDLYKWYTCLRDRKIMLKKEEPRDRLYECGSMALFLILRRIVPGFPAVVRYLDEAVQNSPPQTVRTKEKLRGVS